jgi:predicted nuclease of restriction endonuclease-like (RecB) superfamily
LLQKLENLQDRLWYAHKTIENGWSRSVLMHWLDNHLHKREGKSITNFQNTLPSPQSDLAHQTLKDPYCFDFLSLREKYDEQELEAGLLDHVQKFLLELGAGFSLVGRQVHLSIGGQDFYAEYALRDINKPIGISQYEAAIIESLPKELKGSLPSIEALEQELQDRG